MRTSSLCHFGDELVSLAAELVVLAMSWQAACWIGPPNCG
jgi:hypothetical protein